MISLRTITLISAISLLLFLLLRPVVGSWGAPSVEIKAPQLSREVSPPISPASTLAVAPQHLEGVARAIFEATNSERVQKGLSRLEAEARLAEIATAHCDDMLFRGFFNHEDPDGVGPSERIAANHHRLIGTNAENLWQGTGYTSTDEVAIGRDIVRSWMGSAGHRENILRDGLSHLGVGVSRVGEKMMATQNFAGVWAYLDADLPTEVVRGASLAISAQPRQKLPMPDKMDLYSDGFARWGPYPIAGNRVDAQPGEYQLRLYFPTATGHSILFGPSLTVKP